LQEDKLIAQQGELPFDRRLELLQVHKTQQKRWDEPTGSGRRAAPRQIENSKLSPRVGYLQGKSR
ncbi:MAG TPA: hypothetical protein VJ505_11425, partial [Holophagaceae bacterium]|nr:hypothetical protein [Holophagaceae bacterium]